MSTILGDMLFSVLLVCASVVGLWVAYVVYAVMHLPLYFLRRR